MNVVLKQSLFKIPSLKDLFLFTKKDDEPPADPPADPPKEEGDEMPKWAEKLMEALKPNLPNNQTTEVPVPPAPKTEEEEEDDQQEVPRESLGKKLLNWLW